MGIFDYFRRSNQPIEERASLENPAVSLSDPKFLEYFGLSSISSGGEMVTTEAALGIPPFWAAVNFLSSTMAGLPLIVYEKTSKGRKRSKTSVADILHYAVTDEMSSFEWRKSMFERVFTTGRAFSFIDRNILTNSVKNIDYLDPSHVRVVRKRGQKSYIYQENGIETAYAPSEIIDIPFMLKPDMVGHYSPIHIMREKLAQAIGMTRYGSKFFQNGGVPPFVIKGAFNAPDAMTRASEQFSAALQKAQNERRLALSLPTGHDITVLGIDPSKGQMIESQRFLIEEVARMYSLPTVFLQDLSKGTFSNTEQQDLQLIKHTIKRWCEQTEQEMNLKLFGRENNKFYAEYSLDGLMRGDFKSRMEAYAQGIQNAFVTPNEVRELENRPPMPNGDDLLVQGATVPLGKQPNQSNTQPNS